MEPLRSLSRCGRGCRSPGDDPEDELADSMAASARSVSLRPEHVRELRGLIEETGTELERVLAYYRISALSEMTEARTAARSTCSTANWPNRARRTAAVSKIERLHQNTAEWHRWQQQGFGASDAPVIMSEAVFKTPRMLWSIKTGRMQEEAAEPAARRGRELEQRASRPRAGSWQTRWRRCAWCATNEKDACIVRRPELRRFNRTGDQMPHECARPDRR